METNKYIKVKFNIPLEYITGHLRYAHKEGTVNLTEEEIEKLRENPMDFIYEEDILPQLEFVIDDYDIDDCGSPEEVNYEVIDDAE